MPMLIHHIDEIARNKQRDVIYVMFGKPGFTGPHDFELLDDWESAEFRPYLLKWFEDNGITVQPCAGFSSDGWILAYVGHLYIDVPFDVNNPDYQKIEAFLENPDGTTKFPGVMFCYVALDVAMKHA